MVTEQRFGQLFNNLINIKHGTYLKKKKKTSKTWISFLIFNDEGRVNNNNNNNFVV